MIRAKSIGGLVGCAAILGMTAGGCAVEGPENVTVADSAGVEIVTNGARSVESAAAWSLSVEPVVEIGSGPSPDVALHQVTDVAPLNGGVAVGTLSPPRALVFGSDGTLAATLGREGEGPGEFTSVRSVVPLDGDSVAVWDPDRQRISVFTRDGVLARKVDLEDVAPRSARSAPNASAASGFVRLLFSTSGSLYLFAEGVLGPGEPGVSRLEMPAHRISTGGEELARYGPFPGMAIFHGEPVDGVPVPFGPRSDAATFDGTLAVGTAEAARFRVYGPEGDLARIVRWPEGDRALDGPRLANWTEMLEAVPPQLRKMVEPLPRPDRVPAYEGLISTDAGEILVGDYPGPLGLLPMRRADHGPEAFRPRRRMPARRWLVFDSSGVLTATVRTPEGFEPFAVRDGRMWGVYSDEVDVESVCAYGVTRE